MSDRIAVMNDGKMLQVGTPVEIYEEPASRFIAEFIGDSNLLAVTVKSLKGAECEVDLGAGVTVAARFSDKVQLSEGQKVGLLLRPEMLRLGPAHDGEAPRIKGRIADEVYQGALRRYKVVADGHEIVVEVPNRPELAQLAPGTPVDLYWSTESGVVVP